MPFEFGGSRVCSCLCRAETFHITLKKSMAFPPPSKGSLSPLAQSDLTPLGAQLWSCESPARSFLILHLISSLSYTQLPPFHTPKFFLTHPSFLPYPPLISALLEQNQDFPGFVPCHPLGQRLSQHGLLGIAFSSFKMLIFDEFIDSSFFGLPALQGGE